MEYTFTLKYRLSPQDCDPDDIVERLGAEGCDDALVGVGQPGRIALDFVRDAETAKDALISALADIKRAVPSAKLIEASPDFVGLTDVAEIVGVSRQNMRKLMVTHATSFPAPVHEGSSAVWHLADVLSWLQAKGGYAVMPTTLELAAAAMQINLAKEARQITPKVQREIQTLIA